MKVKKIRNVPGENEEPMKMNMKRWKIPINPRYAYLIKNINLPCCGKKKPKGNEKPKTPIEPSKKSDKLNKFDTLDKAKSDEKSRQLFRSDDDDKNYIMNKNTITIQ